MELHVSLPAVPACARSLSVKYINKFLKKRKRKYVLNQYYVLNALPGDENIQKSHGPREETWWTTGDPKHFVTKSDLSFPLSLWTKSLWSARGGLRASCTGV